MTYFAAAYWLWLAFIATWYVAMLWTAKAVSRGGRGESLLYLAGFMAGFTLLFSTGGADLRTPTGALPATAGWLLTPLWRPSAVPGWLLVAVELGCFAFAWWARVHLGRLWSGMLTLREGHRVVDTGPYRLVRHPIYTGFIGASWTLAVIRATPPSLAGALVLTLVMTIKARNEEALLRRELGAAAYDDYRTRTPMLLPRRRRRS